MELKTNYMLSCDVMNLMYSNWDKTLHIEDEDCQYIEISGIDDSHIIQLTRNAFCAGDSVLERIDRLPEHYKESVRELFLKLHNYFNHE